MPANQIVYTELPSPMGDMIAGATDNGVCFLEWQDRGGVDRIFKRVTKRYKSAPIKDTTNNPHLGNLRVELASYFERELQTFRVRIDVKGTPFETSVWEQLLNIPCGQTRSYAQIAQAIDKPQAVRAVGRANGANYLAIVIPCHRVITSEGTLGGYGGKVWRKKRLLNLESGAEDLWE
ncbi:MAG: methylated-DNA--[protein]-cysteine S-methyltransferase [candidate division Zixibacteria bacterium]